MTSSAEPNSFRLRWTSRGHTDLMLGIDPAAKIIQDHLSEGWRQEEGTGTDIVFAIHLEDGRKWTRHYDKRTCRFVCQEFCSTDEIAQATLGKQKGQESPNVAFGD